MKATIQDRPDPDDSLVSEGGGRQESFKKTGLARSW